MFKEKVVVMMSTYNGEKYLKTQIDSILSQNGVDVNLIVRDDGSTDNTIHILKEYALKGKLTYYVGENLKSAKSFFNLILNAPSSNIYAFSDQDDYWFPNKLLCAIKKIKENIENNKPCLYYSKLIWTDETLKPFTKQHIFIPIVNFSQSIIYNNVAGCTMVFNKNLCEIIKQHIPTSSIMHDDWIFKLCLSIGGNTIFDDNSYIYYRQHSNNVCSGKHSFKKIWKKRFYNLFYNNYTNAFKELLTNYNSIMLPNNILICKKIINYKKSWKYKYNILKEFLFRTKKIKYNIIFVLKILLGTF